MSKYREHMICFSLEQWYARGGTLFLKSKWTSAVNLLLTSKRKIENVYLALACVNVYDSMLCGKFCIKATTTTKANADANLHLHLFFFVAVVLIHNLQNTKLATCKKISKKIIA